MRGAGRMQAIEISGTIFTTLTIYEDSELTAFRATTHAARRT
jgi:hypothetical protein